ncbi:MAG TPA: ribonuclease D [Synechococcus sp. M44_DOE_062]|nr:ribonuclease D [Synechococcus sp. M44_DOE_062]
MGLQTFQLCDEDLTPAMAEALAGEPHLAVDTETMGLIPQRDRLCVVQIANPAGEVVLLRLSRGVKQAPLLARLLTDPNIEKIFHYARFDLAMLRYHLGIRVWPVFCTKIASKLARTYTSKHSLKDVVSELCGVELNKAAQSSDWGAVHALSAEQLEYAANDVRYLIPVRHKLAEMLRREERWELAQRCFQHLPTLVELDLLGFSNVFEHQ